MIGARKILRTLAELGENTIAIIGMRADFYGLAAEEPLLVPLLDDSPMVVGPLTDEQLREVIVEPAVKAGMTVQSELVSGSGLRADTTRLAHGERPRSFALAVTRTVGDLATVDA